MGLKDRVLGLLVAASLAMLSARTTILIDERAEIRDEVDRVAKEMIAQVVADDPALQTVLDESVGYAVGRLSGTKMPFIGGGYGLALLRRLFVGQVCWR